MKKIALLGSTGSIGKNALAVARHLNLEVVALGCHSNLTLLKEQIAAFRPKVVAVADEKAALQLKKESSVEVVVGSAGMAHIATLSEVEFVLMAIVGLAALSPTLAALEAGKRVGLASKEVLVAAGELVMGYPRSSLIPIDSEHSALFQCLEHVASPSRLVLTASGGPFRTYSQEQLASVTCAQALAHPTWKMGPKITIDSSTLMNKGFEVLEAHALFGVPLEQIEVVVHPQSVVHAFVEAEDGAIFAHMHEPSMTLPIQYALTYPERKGGLLPPFDFFAHEALNFYRPDSSRFRCLALAYAAGQGGKSLPCYLNAANEVLVERFLREEIRWQAIGEKLEQLMERHDPLPLSNLDTVLEVDRQARREALHG